MALESLDILFSTIIFEYHNVTHSTQKYTYFKHKRLNRLERFHFELFGIRQQVLTITNIIKKSTLPSSFRRYLSSRPYLSFQMIYLTLGRKVGLFFAKKKCGFFVQWSFPKRVLYFLTRSNLRKITIFFKAKIS